MLFVTVGGKHVAKAQVEFKLSSTVKDNKKVTLKHITAKEGLDITSVHYLIGSFTSQIGI